jgi:hypothetical protein
LCLSWLCHISAGYNNPIPSPHAPKKSSSKLTNMSHRCSCKRCSRGERDFFRQLFLGASPDGQLCVLSHLPSPEKPYFISIDRRKAPALDAPSITKIPDELLSEIFTHAMKSEPGKTGCYHTALALSTVSKHLHRIVQPIMYRTIHLSGDCSSLPCLRVNHFHRTIKRNLALGPMVRTLRLYMGSDMTVGADVELDFLLERELLAFLPNVESLDMRGCFEHTRAWPMINNAIKNWPRLKHLKLLCESRFLLLPPIGVFVLATPNLQTLNIKG